jgi:excisionase family DNA binding protein
MAFFHWHVHNSATDYLFCPINSAYDAFGFKLEAISMETLLSVEEAARKLGGISKWTIHAWLAKGRLRRTKVGGRTMIRESELQRVIRDEPADPAERRE